ncbi:hypothetical protein [Sphingorhabdus sp. SMR4y]|uniref:hypothetical protein n=1 Tax=Sphingorhabdus sp. SMR4y TaxID=2584094 RepID=UPI000B5CBC75|nr:hypothetical protein [Sphingorhabdus sp. SMR4y]ASK87737.1 hypothetical protein SPHFLASMR4Y_00963 [Sphingorhabdus sp. SMR4y]
MINSEPPLWIIAPLPEDLVLWQLPWCEAAEGKISVNRSKFTNLEMAEVIVDAMPLCLSRLTATEVGRKLTAGKIETFLCDLPSSSEEAIGITPGDNLASARHIHEINRRLLLLGQLVGESLSATRTVWLPSGKLVDFPWFRQAAGQYIGGGAFPALLRTTVTEVRTGHFVTRGLDYFAGQEIRLTTSQDCDLAAASRHLVRIIEDITTNGKIVTPGLSEGCTQGETLIYTPSDDLAHVDVSIAIDAVNAEWASLQPQTKPRWAPLRGRSDRRARQIARNCR